MSSGRSCVQSDPLKNRTLVAQPTIIDAFSMGSCGSCEQERRGAIWKTRYGPVGTVSSRFYRWQQAGIWQGILQSLQQQGDASGQIDWEKHSVDSTIIRAHQHAAGAKGGSKIKKQKAASQGGFSTKLHLRAEGKGKLMTFVFTAGQRHEATKREAQMRAGGSQADGARASQIAAKARVGR